MHKIAIIILALGVVFQLASAAFAEETTVNQKEQAVVRQGKQATAATERSQKQAFTGRVNADQVNIRSDSTINAAVVCKVNKGERVDVLSQAYDWYKIRLPNNAPVFIKKELVEAGDNKTGKVLRDNVNLRLSPELSAPILGKVNKDTEIAILEDAGEWYKIKPLQNTFGWIYVTFVNKVDEAKIKSDQKAKEAQEAKDKEAAILTTQEITVEGTLRAKTFTRIATHKLITSENKLYLINGNTQELSSFCQRKVKITGKIHQPANQDNPLVTVEKIEALD